MPENTPIPAWSWTSYSAFQTCPKRYQLTRVTKEVKEPETEVLRWGKAVHAALENRVKDDTPLPEGMGQWEKYARWADSLKDKAQVTTEQQVALDKNLNPVGYWDKSAWVRGVFDLAFVGKKLAGIWDWKTGKIRDGSDQLKLFAGFAFAMYPEIQEVKTGYVWLNHMTMTGETYTRDQVQGIWDTFHPTVDRIALAYENDDWPTRPSGLCRNWCPVPRSLCRHSGRA